MSDAYKGTGAGDMPTAPLRVPGAAPNAPDGRGSGEGGWSPGKRAAAVLGVCALIGGGTFVAVQAATGSPAARPAAVQSAAMPTGAQAGTVASATEQAAVLNAAIAAPGARRLDRLRRLGGMYGQFTYQTKEGARTLAFERGTISSVGGGDVVIRAADGTTYAWALTSTSVVRENGTKEPDAALAQGQTVFAGGLVTGGTRDARLIVIRKAATPKASTAA